MGKIRTFLYSTYIKLIDTRTDIYQTQKLLFFKPSVFYLIWRSIKLKALLQLSCVWISMTLKYVKFHKNRFETEPVRRERIRTLFT